MLICILVMAVTMPQDDSPSDASLEVHALYASPVEQNPGTMTVPQGQVPYYSPPSVACPGCQTQPSFLLTGYPIVRPLPVMAYGPPVIAPVVPLPYPSPYVGPIVAPYPYYPVVPVTPYSFARYPMYSHPHLPCHFNDLRVRSKWHMSSGNMFPPMMGEPAAHGYYYFKPYNYSMVPYQQQAAYHWGESPSQPYLGPLQDGLAARAEAYYSAMHGAPSTWAESLDGIGPTNVQGPGAGYSANPPSNHFQPQSTSRASNPRFR